MKKARIFKMALLMLVLNAAALGAWWWFYSEISNMGKEVADRYSEIVLVDAKQRNIRLLEQTLDEISGEKSRIENTFVDEKKIVRFIEDLEELASLSGVLLEITSASLPTVQGGGEPNFSLSVEGGFGALLKFFSVLEKKNYQLKIETARFNSLQAIWNLQIKFRLVSYRN